METLVAVWILITLVLAIIAWVVIGIQEGSSDEGFTWGFLGMLQLSGALFLLFIIVGWSITTLGWLG